MRGLMPMGFNAWGPEFKWPETRSGQLSTGLALLEKKYVPSMTSKSRQGISWRRKKIQIQNFWTSSLSDDCSSSTRNWLICLCRSWTEPWENFSFWMSSLVKKLQDLKIMIWYDILKQNSWTSWRVSLLLPVNTVPVGCWLTFDSIRRDSIMPTTKGSRTWIQQGLITIQQFLSLILWKKKLPSAPVK